MTYFPPKQPEYNYLSHLIILSWDVKKPITKKELDYYVAHINHKGKPDDWFFDSFLVILGNSPSGNNLYYDFNMGTTRCSEGDFFAVPHSNPGKAQDWLDYIDYMFSKDGVFHLLENSIADMKNKMKLSPTFKRNIVISIPHPHSNQSNFGPIGNSKKSLNFSIIGQNLMKASEQRLEACKWFVDEVSKRFKKEKFKELNFLGFYWIYESLHYSWDVDDHWVIKELYKYIHEKEYALFWIPFYSSYNVHIMSDSPGFYFDCSFLQPNHMFYKGIKDVKQAALEAKERNGGIEIEYYMDIYPEADIGDIKFKRFRNYLNGGIKYGYMTESACAYFIGVNDIPYMATNKNKKEREAYHDLFHFVKGDYELK